jgi:hypothetical protein
MFESKSSPLGWRSFACVAALPLVMFSLVGGPVHPVDRSVQVVDGFLAARAARDLDAVATLLPSDATIVDTTHSLTLSGDDWYRLLPLADELQLGSRHLEPNGEVTWTELVLDDGRPSWEHNLNWFMDGSPLVESEPLATSVFTATAHLRTMRASVSEGGITHLEIR